MLTHTLQYLLCVFTYFIYLKAVNNISECLWNLSLCMLIYESLSNILDFICPEKRRVEYILNNIHK